MFDLFKRKAADAPPDARPWSERLKSGLALSRDKLAGTLAGVFSRRKLDDEALELLETALLTADVGVAATARILEEVKDRYRRAGPDASPRAALRDSILALVKPLESPLVVSAERPFVIVLADTAGRLPTQMHLMDELAKVKRVLGKARAGAPDEALLVLDANTGQNALAQVKAFDAAIGLTGLILTKLDGSAKGGVVAAIAGQHPVPLKFIGVGEGIDDLRPFNAADFVEALLPDID